MAQGTKIKIIDSHVHILHPSHLSYHWLEKGSALDRDFVMTDLNQVIQGHNVVGGILMEATNSPQEIPYLLNIVEKNNQIWGVIGWITLEEPHAPEQIAHFSQHPSFKGVRLNWLDTRQDTQNLYQAMKAIEKHGLVVDILANWDYLAEIIPFVSDYANVQFVLNHFGGVVITLPLLPIWQNLMHNFATLPNVALKISGYSAYPNTPLTAYVESALQLFGENRLMFGSNLPIHLSTTSYDQIVCSLQEATQSLGIDQALFHDTANRIYGLKI